MKKTTRRPKPAEIKEIWHLIDAKGLVLGRLSTKIANILMGKNTPMFDPAITPKTKVVVINANDIKLTGRKLEQKEHIRYSGYPGGLSRIPMARIMAEKSPEALRHAVYGMLPKNRLRKGRMDNLKIYATEAHPHQAQNPIKLEL
ncbi:50S ribosomal protein L13 [Patescibacteria group bacterium]|nr:50S ribosomal protein L13 [Patescibacteria group bacterium]